MERGATPEASQHRGANSETGRRRRQGQTGRRSTSSSMNEECADVNKIKKTIQLNTGKRKLALCRDIDLTQMQAS